MVEKNLKVFQALVYGNANNLHVKVLNVTTKKK